MNSLETRAIETFNSMWREWGHLSEENFEEALRFWPMEMQSFGTAKHEIWRGKEDLRKYGNKLLASGESHFRVENVWLESKVLAPPYVGIYGEIIIHMPMEGKTLRIGPIRVTGVLEDKGEHMEWVQWHSSEPDVSSEEDIWPGTAEPKRYEEVSVLFTDFVGFTNTVTTIPAKRLVSELNEIFAAFDEINSGTGMDKIKTIGDAYMAVCGLKNEKDHAVKSVKAAMGMLDFLRERNNRTALKWHMRAGIHSGSVVAGVIGSEKLSFDLWGDTVNLAHRMESSGEAGKINVSAYTYDLIRTKFSCSYRGKLEVKNRGEIDMYFVD